MVPNRKRFSGQGALEECCWWPLLLGGLDGKRERIVMDYFYKQLYMKFYMWVGLLDFESGFLFSVPAIYNLVWSVQSRNSLDLRNSYLLWDFYKLSTWNMKLVLKCIFLKIFTFSKNLANPKTWEISVTI